jgi:hypothetical protein
MVMRTSGTAPCFVLSAIQVGSDGFSIMLGAACPDFSGTLRVPIKKPAPQINGEAGFYY